MANDIERSTHLHLDQSSLCILGWAYQYYLSAWICYDLKLLIKFYAFGSRLIHFCMISLLYRCIVVIEALQYCCEKCSYKSTHCASLSGLLGSKKEFIKQMIWKLLACYTVYCKQYTNYSIIYAEFVIRTLYSKLYLWIMIAGEFFIVNVFVGLLIA